MTGSPQKPGLTNVPRVPLSFLGRREALETLTSLLVPEGLVTILGPAGTGKTRLALRYAELHGNRYMSAGGGGAWFCDLTEARDVDAVIGAVAGALGVELARTRHGDEATAKVGDVLSRRGTLLLVLDNCEQAVDAVAKAVTAWSEVAPGARFLATSREPLRIPGERLLDLAPLSLPRDDDIAGSEAVQLFVDRAGLLRPGYALSDDNASDIAALVRSLDGIPLAIELAAARMGLLGVRDVLRLMSRRFELLSRATHGVSERQRTLRGAIEWSWELLEPWERSALAQCSVFRGGFSVEAAEAVLGLEAHPDAPPILDVLQALRDKSLLRAEEHSGEMRLGLYESVRDFAGDKLAASGEGEATLGRHARHFVDAGSGWAAGVWLRGGAQKMARLARERDNLLAVHERAMAPRGDSESARAEEASRVALALSPLYEARGPASAWASLLDRTLDLAARAQPPPAGLGVLFVERARVQLRLGDRDRVLADVERALAEEGGGDRIHRVRALNLLSNVAWTDGDVDRAVRIANEAAESAADDPQARALALGILGTNQAAGGALVDSVRSFEAACDLLHDGGDLRRYAAYLSNLGSVLSELGRPDEGQRRMEEGIAACLEVGDTYTLGGIQGSLARLHHEHGNLAEARRRYEEAIATLDRTGERRWASLYLAALGAIVAEEGDLDQARRLLDRAESELPPGAPVFAAAVRLHRGHLDLSTAHQRIAEAAPYEASSDDVRSAVMLLRRALVEKTEAPAPPRDTVPPDVPDDVLLVGPDGRWLRPPGGARVELRRQESARRILLAMVRHRRDAEGRGLSTSVLAAHGWPGERILPEAAANRVRVAITRLRKLGLENVIEHVEDGYRIRPTSLVYLME